jgi:hypothetical protein
MRIPLASAKATDALTRNHEHHPSTPDREVGMNGGVAMLVLVALLIGLVVRVLAGSLDQDRVQQYVESRGGKLLTARWAPLGPGWLGEKSDRIYQVRYVDAQGNEHEAHCKTSLWTGVYFTQDSIVKPAGPQRDVAALEEENERPRRENEELRHGQA